MGFLLRGCNAGGILYFAMKQHMLLAEQHLMLQSDCPTLPNIIYQHCTSIL